MDTWEGFIDTVKSVTKEIKSVSELATARQQELKSSAAQQLIVAANTELKQCNKMLITSTKVGIFYVWYASSIVCRCF